MVAGVFWLFFFPFPLIGLEIRVCNILKFSSARYLSTMMLYKYHLIVTHHTVTLMSGTVLPGLISYCIEAKKALK